jgi:hypothetical protein
MWLVFFIHPNNINLIHKGRARVNVSVRCLVLVKMYGNNPRKQRLSNLALEVDGAIPLLSHHEQEHIWYHVAHKLCKLYKQHSGKHTVVNDGNNYEWKYIEIYCIILL